MTDPTAADDLADCEPRTSPRAAHPPDTDPGWAGLLEYLLTLARLRFSRVQAGHAGAPYPEANGALEIESFAAYQDHLEVHPDEFATLFNTILINVTGFFRDPDAWEVVRNQVGLPESLSAKAPGEPIRAWSAGCATGEEAYTIAMVLAEELGAGRVPGAGEDLRHRRGRGRARTRHGTPPIATARSRASRPSC